MAMQAILIALHFIRSKLVVAGDFIPKKSTPQDIERKTLYDRQDINVLLFIGDKIKLKFLITLFLTRGCAIYGSLPWVYFLVRVDSRRSNSKWRAISKHER